MIKDIPYEEEICISDPNYSIFLVKQRIEAEKIMKAGEEKEREKGKRKKGEIG